MRRLDGWLRLWIACSVLYGALVSAVTWLDWPTLAPKVTTDELIQALPAALAGKVAWGPPTRDELKKAQSRAEAADKQVVAHLLAGEIERLHSTNDSKIPVNTKRVTNFLRGSDGDVYVIHSDEGATEKEAKEWFRNQWKVPAAKGSTYIIGRDSSFMFGPEVIEMDDELTIELVVLTTHAEQFEVVQTWKHLSERKLFNSRWSAVRAAFLIWVVPCLLLLAIGQAAQWVCRGFRGTR